MRVVLKLRASGLLRSKFIGSLLVIHIGNYTTLDKSFFKALEKHTGTTVVIHFTHKGQQYSFVILPGTTEEELFGDQKFAGFL